MIKRIQGRVGRRMVMMIFSLKAKALFFVIVFLLLAGIAYCVIASLSEHREYKKSGIDYWLLTPKEISGIAKLCKDAPNFIYSAADGAKPLVVQLKCTATQSEVVSYLERNGFVKMDTGSYKSDEKEIELTQGAEGIVTMATLLVFL